MFRTRTSEPSDPGPHTPASRRFRSFARRALPLATTTLCARHRHRDRPHQCLKGRFAHGSRTRSFRNREALSLRSFDEQPHPFVIIRNVEIFERPYSSFIHSSAPGVSAENITMSDPARRLISATMVHCRILRARRFTCDSVPGAMIGVFLMECFTSPSATLRPTARFGSHTDAETRQPKS